MSSQGNSYIPKSIRLHHCLLALKTRQHLMVPTFFLPIFPLLLKSVVTMPGLGHCSGFELTSCLDANLLKFIHKSAAFVPCYGGVGSLIHPFLAVILHWCNLSVTLWFSICLCCCECGLGSQVSPWNVYTWELYKHRQRRIYSTFALQQM